MINEKGLLAAMKKAYKSRGYVICAYREDDEKRYFINAHYWCVDIASNSLPRKVLSLIVEHIGDIPEGCTLEVTKTFGLQEVMKETVLDLKEKITSDEGETIKKTPLCFKNLQVWQVEENLEIVLLDPNFSSIVEGGELWECGYRNDLVMWWDGDTTAAVARTLDTDERVSLLENSAWL